MTYNDFVYLMEGKQSTVSTALRIGAPTAIGGLTGTGAGYFGAYWAAVLNSRHIKDPKERKKFIERQMKKNGKNAAIAGGMTGLGVGATLGTGMELQHRYG